MVSLTAFDGYYFLLDIKEETSYDYYDLAHALKNIKLIPYCVLYANQMQTFLVEDLQDRTKLIQLVDQTIEEYYGDLLNKTVEEVASDETTSKLYQKLFSDNIYDFIDGYDSRRHSPFILNIRFSKCIIDILKIEELMIILGNRLFFEECYISFDQCNIGIINVDSTVCLNFYNSVIKDIILQASDVRIFSKCSTFRCSSFALFSQIQEYQDFLDTQTLDRDESGKRVIKNFKSHIHMEPNFNRVKNIYLKSINSDILLVNPILELYTYVKDGCYVGDTPTPALNHIPDMYFYCPNLFYSYLLEEYSLFTVEDDDDDDDEVEVQGFC